MVFGMHLVQQNPRFLKTQSKNVIATKLSEETSRNFNKIGHQVETQLAEVHRTILILDASYVTEKFFDFA